MKAPAPPSLYAWLGGQARLAALTDAFYRKVALDPLLAPVFAHMDAEHPHDVARFLAEVFGGADAYTRERGGHAHMIRRHLERHLDDTLRKRWVALLLETADEVGMPADPEFRSAFVSYIEWGTRIAVITSQPGAQVTDDQPMSRWGWSEVKRPYVAGEP